MKYYAGIGSRDITAGKRFENLMIRIGAFLAEEDFVLRSGAADGADSLFEEGCDKVSGKKEIFLPWKNFNGSKSLLYNVSEEAYILASEYHKGWYNLGEPARKLIARNGYQVLGLDLNNPVEFVICYTPRGIVKGGTAQGIKIAKSRSIPVFNIGEYEGMNTNYVFDKFMEFYNK